MRDLDFEIIHLSQQQQRSLPEEQQLQAFNNKRNINLQQFHDYDKRIEESRGIISRNECEKKSENKPLIKSSE
jgi:hypothetical protein